MTSSDKQSQDLPGAQVLPTETDRNESYMADINSRIARLAIALHVSLRSDDDVRAALHELAQDLGPVPEVTSSIAADGHVHAPVDGSQKRNQALRSELRGLLVMRYGAEQRLVQNMGVQAAHKLMADTEARLQREGFQPGADGVNLNQMFDPD